MIQRKSQSFSQFAIFHPLLNLLQKPEVILFPRKVVFSSASSFFESSLVSVSRTNKSFERKSVTGMLMTYTKLMFCLKCLPSHSAPGLATFQGGQRLPHWMLKICETHIRLNTRVSCITTYYRQEKATKDSRPINQPARREILELLNRDWHRNSHCALSFQWHRQGSTSFHRSYDSTN